MQASREGARRRGPCQSRRPHPHPRSNAKPILILAAAALLTVGSGYAGRAAHGESKDGPAKTIIETVRGADSGKLVGLDLAVPALRLEGRQLPLREVLRVELNHAVSYRRELVVHLMDRSVLYGGLGTDSDDVSLSFNGRLFPDGIRIPLEWVRQLDYRGDSANPPKPTPPSFAAINDEDAILTAEGAVLRGVLDSVDGRQVIFEERKLGRLTLPWKQVRSVRIAALDAPPKLAPKVPGLIEGVDGSLLYGGITALDTTRAALESPLIGKVDVETARIHAVEFHLGRVAYLSDRDPIRVVERGCHDLGFHWPWQRDANVFDKGPLRIGTQTYRRGLGVHSESHLTFAIEDGDKTFQTWIGIDATGHPANGNPKFGSAVFRILVDGQERHNSGNLNWQALPRRVEVDLQGGKELELVVEMGEGLYILDRADWGDARILRD
ncbi:MAG: NPCBM/NEW2 domain-containing protein [Planctomycetota bacterium]